MKQKMLELITIGVVVAACDEGNDDQTERELPESTSEATYGGIIEDNGPPPLEMDPGTCARGNRELAKLKDMKYLAAEDGRLYATTGLGEQHNTILYAIDLDDGEPHPIASRAGRPAGLATHDDFIYFATALTREFEHIDIYRVGRAGGQVKKLVNDEAIHGFAADGNDLWFFRGIDPDEAKLVRRSLTSDNEVIVRRRPAAPFVIDAQYIWVGSRADAMHDDVVLSRIDKSSGQERVIVRAQDLPGARSSGGRQVFQDATHVYSAGPDGWVIRVNKVNNAVATVVQLPEAGTQKWYAYGSVDDGFLYHFDGPLNQLCATFPGCDATCCPPEVTRLSRLSLETGELATLMEADAGLGALASDGACLYFGDFGPYPELERDVRVRVAGKQVLGIVTGLTASLP